MRRGTALLALLLLVTHSPCADAAGPSLLFDVTSGKVLHAEGADNPWHPASLTKLMTAYLVFEAVKEGRLSLDSKVTCSAAAHDKPPSKIGLPIGGEMAVDTALQALIVKSANDVAVMLAEAVAGSESAFVERMNAAARRLGMVHTRFANSNGLPAPEQVTTARDLAKLSRAIITEFPEHTRYWSMAHMKLGKMRLRSHNGLLQSFEGADGLKTGFTCDSGFNIVASATRDGRRLVAVVLGDTTSGERNLRAASLLEYGFRQGGWAQFFNSTTLDNMPFSPTETGVRSVRASIESWNCNNKPKVAKGKSGKKTAKASGAKAGAKKAAPNVPDGALSAQAAGAEPWSLELKGSFAPDLGSD